jgi:hypothetical protein
MLGAALLALSGTAQAANVQKQLILNCAAVFQCSGSTAAVPAGKTLTIDSFSCRSQVLPGGVDGFAQIGTTGFFQTAPAMRTLNTFISTSVVQTRLVVKATKVLIFVIQTEGGQGQTMSNAVCSYTGTIK